MVLIAHKLACRRFLRNIVHALGKREGIMTLGLSKQICLNMGVEGCRLGGRKVIGDVASQALHPRRGPYGV